MKTKRPSWPYVPAAGMLCLGMPLFLKFFFSVQGPWADFLKGFGVALSIGSLFLAGKERRALAEKGAWRKLHFRDKSDSGAVTLFGWKF